MGKEYVVIGLGRFGGSIVRELNALDMDVMAIDHDENRVNEIVISLLMRLLQTQQMKQL